MHQRSRAMPHAFAGQRGMDDRTDRRRPITGCSLSVAGADLWKLLERRSAGRRDVPAVVDVLEIRHEPRGAVAAQPFDGPYPERGIRRLLHRNTEGDEYDAEQDREHQSENPPRPSATGGDAPWTAPLPDSPPDRADGQRAAAHKQSQWDLNRHTRGDI